MQQKTLAAAAILVAGFPEDMLTLKGQTIHHTITQMMLCIVYIAKEIYATTADH